MSYVENAKRLRRELNEALRTPIPSVLKIKLLVNDLVNQVEDHAVALEKLEKLHAQIIEKQDHLRITIDA